MKAMVQDEYGPADVLRLAEVDRPAVGPDQVLVRVRAASVNPADWHFMKGEPYIARLQAGLRKPKAAVLGCDLAGTVEAVGANVTEPIPGDEVFGSPFMRGFGAFAEFCALPSDAVSRKPANLSFAEAATVPLAGLTALQALRDHGQVERGRRVLVVGASGGVGTFAVQLAKAFGADVTGVCSGANADLVRSLGADRVLDYAEGDFTEGNERYDLVLQLAGPHGPSALRRLLTPEGTLVLSSGESDGRWIGPVGRIIKASLMSPFVGQRLTSFTVAPNRPDLETLTELLEAGRLRPVIGRTFALSETPEAIRQVEGGHTRGKMVIAH
jgi:NADPH:quinone reductase-like Zn-dependent oxidoreductase